MGCALAADRIGGGQADGRQASPLDAHKQWLLELIAAQPDLTLEEIRGRLALANSIALTPGSLVLDIKDDTLFVHWLDVRTIDPDEATRIIAGPFEGYLEKVFG